MEPIYGHRIRILHWSAHQAMTQTLAEQDLTASQGHILNYLARSPQPPCPRDIEDAFQLSHPTVSGLLNRLEKKGFISIRPDETDRRCKRILLEPKGQQTLSIMAQTIDACERRMVKDFTPQEQQQFAAYLERAIINMGGHPCPPLHKEELN